MKSLTPKERRDLIEILRIEEEELIRKSAKNLYTFTKYVWDVIEPETDFVDGWHIEVICEHLESVTTFDIKRLLINEPPRHMKSIIACVTWPAWVWGRYPGRSFIFGSHSASLAQRDSILCRQLIKSEKYQRIFRPDWALREDQDTLSKFKNTKGGVRRSVGVGSSVTGEGGDYLVVDDPHDVGEIYSELAREKVLYWWKKTLSSRINNPKRNAKVVVMQRLHEDDLCGNLLKERGHLKYNRLVLPAEYDPDHEIKSETKRNFIDPRTEKGQLLWPQRWTQESLNELREDLGDDAEAQLNQDPKPSGGSLFNKEDWVFYDAAPSTIIKSALFIDCAQKPGISNDYSVFAMWAKSETGLYLLDLLREKTDAPLLELLTVQAFEKLRPDAIVIEDKSAGSSLIQYLRRNTTLPVIAFDPGQRDKVVRATAAAPTVRAKKCHLPRRIDGKEDRRPVNLIDVFIKEHLSFPRAKHDDIVDTTSMAVEYFNRYGVIKPRIRAL